MMVWPGLSRSRMFFDSAPASSFRRRIVRMHDVSALRNAFSSSRCQRTPLNAGSTFCTRLVNVADEALCPLLLHIVSKGGNRLNDGNAVAPLGQPGFPYSFFLLFLIRRQSRLKAISAKDMRARWRSFAAVHPKRFEQRVDQCIDRCPPSACSLPRSRGCFFALDCSRRPQDIRTQIYGRTRSSSVFER
jgi:hypothetical protein